MEIPMNAITEIVELQLAAQSQMVDEAYEADTAARDTLIAKLTRRQRVHAKLAFGILDRLLNPVR
jgi:hypothetical protein